MTPAGRGGFSPRLSGAFCALLALAACKRTPPPPGDAPAAASASAPASASASGAASAGAPEADASGAPAGSAAPAPAPAPDLLLRGVSHQDFVRRTLYLWVSGEQAALLRRDRSLVEPLLRSKTPRLEASLAAAKDPTTLQLLRTLKKSDRKPVGLAWANPWGTALQGLSQGSGKRHVVKATLRPEAYVGIYDATQKRPWRFVDGQGQDVAPGKVMARPELLGAIYYELPGDPGPPARGYALVSEEALAAWSTDTAEIDAELGSAALAIEALPAPAGPDDAWPKHLHDEVWPSVVDTFESSLAVADPAYHPAHRDELAAALRAARAAGKPFSQKPSAAGRPFSDLVEKGVQRQVCTEHGDKTRCAPMPPSRRRAHDQRFCVDEQGRMMDCPRR